MEYLEFKFLKRLKDFAKLTKKSIEQRAKELSSDKNIKNSQKFWQVLLEGLEFWAINFKYSSQGKKFKYNQVYDELRKSKGIK